MLSRFGLSQDASTIRPLIETCLLADDVLTDRTRISSLVMRINGTEPPSRGDFSLAGAALYRAGRFGEALTNFDKAIAVDSKGPRGTVHDLLFMAMAHSRLGHFADAQECWKESAKFESIVEEWVRQAKRDSPMAAMECGLLRKEVQRVIRNEEPKVHVPRAEKDPKRS